MKENCVWFKIGLKLQETPSMRLHHTNTTNTKTVDISMDLIVKCKCKSENHTRASDKKKHTRNRHSPYTIRNGNEWSKLTRISDVFVCMYYYWRQSFDCRFCYFCFDWRFNFSLRKFFFLLLFVFTSSATSDSCRTLRDNLIFMFHGVDVRCTSPQFIHTRCKWSEYHLHNVKLHSTIGIGTVEMHNWTYFFFFQKMKKKNCG